METAMDVGKKRPAPLFANWFSQCCCLRTLNYEHICCSSHWKNIFFVKWTKLWQDALQIRKAAAKEWRGQCAPTIFTWHTYGNMVENQSAVFTLLSPAECAAKRASRACTMLPTVHTFIWRPYRVCVAEQVHLNFSFASNLVSFKTCIVFKQSQPVRQNVNSKVWMCLQVCKVWLLIF